MTKVGILHNVNGNKTTIPNNVMMISITKAMKY